MTPGRWRLIIAVLERGGFGQGAFVPLTGVHVSVITSGGARDLGWLDRGHPSGVRWSWRVTREGYEAAREVDAGHVDAALVRGAFGDRPFVVGRGRAPRVPGFNDKRRNAEKGN